MAEHSEDLVGVEALADKPRYGKLPASWWYANAEAGKVPSYKIGKYRRFRISEIVAHFDAQRQGPRPA
jgi:hypothetical protein